MLWDAMKTESQLELSSWDLEAICQKQGNSAQDHPDTSVPHTYPALSSLPEIVPFMLPIPILLISK